MKQMHMFSAISLILLATTVSVYADVARPPKPSPQKGKVVMTTGLEVVPDANAYDARLQIPRARLGELRAALANEGGNESAARGVAYNSTRTIVAGIFCSCRFLLEACGWPGQATAAVRKLSRP